MISMQITSFGDALGVALTDETLVKLGAREGDFLYLTQTPNGEFRLRVLDAEVAEQVRIGEEIMDRYDDTFRTLAK